MKRQIFTLLMVLVLAMATTALMAQSTNNSQLPPSQQVDQSGHPETGTGPDVDVDTGRNADNGVLDVDVNRHTDSDTKAQDHGQTTGTMGDHNMQGTATGTTGTNAGSYNGNNADNTGVNGDNANLPGTASNTPLVGLIGLLALGLAFTLRAIR